MLVFCCIGPCSKEIPERKKKEEKGIRLKE
jgi:hypothetical protein